MVSIINTEYKRKNKIDRGKDSSSPLCNFCGRSKKNLARRGEETSYLVWDLESIPEVIHIWTLLLLGHFVSEDKHISRFLNYYMILELILELLVFLTTVYILDASEQFDLKRIFTWSLLWVGGFHFLNFFSVLLDFLTWRYLTYYLGFSGGSDLKNPPALWVIWVWSLGGRSPGGEHGNPLKYSCLENPHGQRSLAGYSPWGHKESDTTEWFNTATHYMQVNRSW